MRQRTKLILGMIGVVVLQAAYIAVTVGTAYLLQANYCVTVSEKSDRNNAVLAHITENKDVLLYAPEEQQSKEAEITAKEEIEEEAVAKMMEESNETFFEGALFIGDSRTEGLFINTGLTTATFYAIKGLAVDNIYEKKFVKNDKNKKETVLKALKHNDFQAIYIMLGVNELGWAYEDLFIAQYAQLIRDIKERQPEAAIYIQSILPVTKKKSENDEIHNNKKIERYNELIFRMAAEEKVTYLDVTASVQDEKGNLDSNASPDGVHLNKEYCNLWLDYLKLQTYVVQHQETQTAWNEKQRKQ